MPDTVSQADHTDLLKRFWALEAQVRELKQGVWPKGADKLPDHEALTEARADVFISYFGDTRFRLAYLVEWLNAGYQQNRSQDVLDMVKLCDYLIKRREAESGLLESAERVINYVVAGGEELSPIFNSLRSAIAKAKGE